jgi:catalase
LSWRRRKRQASPKSRRRLQDAGADTPQEFLQFLRCIAASGAEPPDPAPLAAFLAGHPRARRYLETPKPTPASYLAERYYGVNAFRFINREGGLTYGRYRVDPTIDEPLLEDREAIQRPHDFLAQDLVSRVRQRPAEMRLLLQLPATEDVLFDNSIAWPRSGPQARSEIELGLISVDSVAEAHVDDQHLAFNPGHLIDGISLSDDLMIAVRQRVYQLASTRRRT